MVRISTLLSAVSLFQSSLAAYNLVQDYSGTGFFDQFDFYTDNDPTNGYVNYVDQATAEAAGLINTDNGAAYIGVDSTNIATGRGRSSVRLSSKASFTQGLVVINLGHMPASTCGTWPAFWTLGPDWPGNGEIDIIEGVNDQSANFMTLHTSPNCAVTNGGSGILQPYSQDCNTAVNGNEGCSYHETDPASYGTTLNQNNGAIYAMEWTSAGISIWWWGGANPAPADVLSASPNPGNWGPPTSNWAGDGCVWDSHFANHNIVFDMTFCGDWAGQVFGTDPVCSAKGACNDYVANNPADFAESYWSVNALKFYQNGVDGKRDASAYNETATFEQVKRCQDSGLCRREPVEEVEDRAAASQIAPQKVPKASQTVDSEKAVKAAKEEVGKRAAGSQTAPERVPKASQTVDAEMAVSRAKKEKESGGNGGKGKRGFDMMAEIRRRRFADHA